jgi:hypothetical protein
VWACASGALVEGGSCSVELPVEQLHVLHPVSAQRDVGINRGQHCLLNFSIQVTVEIDQLRNVNLGLRHHIRLIMTV